MAKGDDIMALVASAPKRSGSGGGEMEDDMEPSLGSAERMAAEDMIAAIKAGDAKALASSCRRMMEACGALDGSDDEEMMEGEDEGAYGES